MKKNTKLPLVDVIQVIFYVTVMVLMASFPCSAQETDSGGVHLYSDAGVIFIRETGAGHEFVRNLKLQPNQVYDVMLFVCSIADSTLGEPSYAQDVKFTLHYPENISADTPAELTAMLTAANADRAVTGDIVEVTVTEDLKITCTDESGQLYPVRHCNGDLEFQDFINAATVLLDGEISVSGLIGDLPSSEDSESIAVVFLQFRTEAVATDYSGVGKIMLGCGALAIIVLLGAAIFAKRR